MLSEQVHLSKITRLNASFQFLPGNPTKMTSRNYIIEISDSDGEAETAPTSHNPQVPKNIHDDLYGKILSLLREKENSGTSSLKKRAIELAKIKTEPIVKSEPIVKEEAISPQPNPYIDLFQLAEKAAAITKSGPITEPVAQLVHESLRKSTIEAFIKKENIGEEEPKASCSSGRDNGARAPKKKCDGLSSTNPSTTTVVRPEKPSKNHDQRSVSVSDNATHLPQTSALSIKSDDSMQVSSSTQAIVDPEIDFDSDQTVEFNEEDLASKAIDKDTGRMNSTNPVANSDSNICDIFREKLSSASSGISKEEANTALSVLLRLFGTAATGGAHSSSEAISEQKSSKSALFQKLAGLGNVGVAKQNITVRSDQINKSKPTNRPSPCDVSVRAQKGEQFS